MNIFKIRALDFGDYKEGEIIDVFFTNRDLNQEEALKEWAAENNRRWECFIAKKTTEEKINEELKSLAERVAYLDEKREHISKKVKRHT